MRIDPNQKLWVVIDPTPTTEDGENMFQASLADLFLQFKGGLTMEENPTLFTDREEAAIEAYGRLTAMRASRAIARNCGSVELQKAHRLEILDGEGNLLFETEF